jgi:hypothetical protein
VGTRLPVWEIQEEGSDGVVTLQVRHDLLSRIAPVTQDACPDRLNGLAVAQTLEFGRPRHRT